jgi:hypothetical protein
VDEAGLFSKMFVQITPSNAGARNPENPIQNKTMISRTPPTTRTALNHKGLKTGPFLVTHQTPDHGNLPKATLNQKLHSLGKPFVIKA